MPNNPHTPLRVDHPLIPDYNKWPIQDNIDPLVINWKGKIGYGDIISPISYALNMAQKNSTDVILRFHWKQSEPKKYKESDKETIQQWIDTTYNMLEKNNFYGVKIEHQYNSDMRFNHDNYDATEMQMHNLRFTNMGFNDYRNGHNEHRNITMVTSIKHKQTLQEYDKNKAWKDPMANTPQGYSWPRIGELIRKRDWNVKHVHYEDTMDSVVKKMLTSRCVIGYHGAHMWIARMLGLPMIIFSKGKITERAFPWAITWEYWSDFHPELIEEYIEKSIEKRNEVINDYRYWLTTPNIHRLRQQRN
jgi:hypothetical protein